MVGKRPRRHSFEVVAEPARLEDEKRFPDEQCAGRDRRTGHASQPGLVSSKWRGGSFQDQNIAARKPGRSRDTLVRLRQIVVTHPFPWAADPGGPDLALEQVLADKQETPVAKDRDGLDVLVAAGNEVEQRDRPLRARRTRRKPHKPGIALENDDAVTTREERDVFSVAIRTAQQGAFGVAHRRYGEVSRPDERPILAFEKLELDEVAAVGYGGHAQRVVDDEPGETAKARIIRGEQKRALEDQLS